MSTTSPSKKPSPASADPARRGFLVKLMAMLTGGLATLVQLGAGAFVFLDPLRKKAGGAFYVYPDIAGVIGKTTPDGKRIDPEHCPSPRDLDPLAVELREQGGTVEVWIKFETFLAGSPHRIVTG